jgi:protein O-GlcNAc transferase
VRREIEIEIEMISLQSGGRPAAFGSARDDAVGGFQLNLEPSASSSATLSLLPLKGRDSHHEG